MAEECRIDVNILDNDLALQTRHTTCKACYTLTHSGAAAEGGRGGDCPPPPQYFSRGASPPATYRNYDDGICVAAKRATTIYTRVQK